MTKFGMARNAGQSFSGPGWPDLAASLSLPLWNRPGLQELGDSSPPECIPAAYEPDHFCELLPIERISTCSLDRLDSVSSSITLLRRRNQLEQTQFQISFALSCRLIERWNLTGHLMDLDEAIGILHRLVSRWTEKFDAGKVHLSLAAALAYHHRSIRDPDDTTEIHAAVHHARLALEIFDKCPPQSLYSTLSRCHLAHYLGDLTLATGLFDDVDEAVRLSNEAVSWCNNHGARYPLTTASFMTASAVLSIRMEHREPSSDDDVHDLQKLHESALSTVSQTHSPLRARLHYEISVERLTLATCRPNSHSHFPESKSALYTAISDPTVAADVRVVWAVDWLARAGALSAPETLVDVYIHTLDMLSRASLVGMDRRARLHALRHTRGLATRAALSALAAARVQDALVMMEQGRGGFWKRAFWLRWPVRHLPHNLGGELARVFAELEGHSARADGDTLCRRLQLSDEFEALIGRVREEPGHGRFLLPITFQHMLAAAQDGPIVAFLVGPDTSAAIIVHPAPRAPEWLPLDLTPELVEQWAQQFQEENVAMRARLSSGRDARKMKKLRANTNAMSYADLLASLWSRVVSPVIRKLNLEKCSHYSRRPRIWFCPVGSLMTVPLHAAGIYLPEIQDCLSDYVVCSYTPMMNGLNKARESISNLPTTAPEDLRVLLVAEPEAPDRPPLPNAVLEMNEIGSLVPPNYILRPNFGREFFSWTPEEILDTIPRVSVLHLACHGQQDAHDPLQSGFFIGNRNLTIAEIMKLRIPNAQLAFLSACETAKGDLVQPDELIHLASTMMFLGFPSVVATMWSMNDTDGPHVSRMVYEEVFRDGVFRRERVPYAIDLAVRTLREKGVHPSRWATYLHMGI